MRSGQLKPKDYTLATLKRHLNDLLVAWELKDQYVDTETIMKYGTKTPSILPHPMRGQSDVKAFEGRCTLTKDLLAQEFTDAAARGSGTVFIFSTDGHAKRRVYFATYLPR